MKQQQKFKDELRIHDDFSEESFDDIIPEDIDEDWNANRDAILRWREKKCNREKEFATKQSKTHPKF